MSLEVLNFELCPNKTKIGCILVRYHDLVMRCDLVFYAPSKKAWIRMPEKWFSMNKKTSFCSWPKKEISDEFQKEVLEKIFDKYDLDLSKVEEIHRAAYEKRGRHRNE